jgi:hypothetical protein
VASGASENGEAATEQATVEITFELLADERRERRAGVAVFGRGWRVMRFSRTTRCRARFSGRRRS